MGSKPRKSGLVAAEDNQASSAHTLFRGSDSSLIVAEDSGVSVPFDSSDRDPRGPVPCRPASRSPWGQSRGRVVVWVTFLTALVSAVGYFREAVFASRLGASASMDAYLAALFVPNTLYFVLIAGTISPVFMAVFSQHETGSHEEALVVFRVTTTFSAVVLSALVVLGMSTARFWLPLVFSGFSPGQLQLSLQILYVIFPSIVFLGLAGIVAALLNSLAHFTTPALSPAMYALATVPVLLLAPQNRLVQWLTIATAFGLAAQLFVQLPTAAALGVHWRPNFNFRHPALRQLMRLAVPLLAYLVVANASLVIERNIASKLATGAVSVVNYATRLFTIPGNLLIMPLAVVFYPSFAREAARKERGNLGSELRDALRVTVFLALPVGCWMVMYALPLTRLVFERGQFDLSNSARTAGMLAFYSLGLLPNALAVILLRAFYALQDTVTPLVAEGANLLCYAWAAPRLARHYGVSGLGAARAGSFLLVALVLILVLRRKLAEFWPRLSGAGFLLKIICGCCLMGLATGLAWRSLDNIFEHHQFGVRSLVVAFLGGLGATVYLGTCYFLGVREVRLILSSSFGWLKPIRAVSGPQGTSV